MGPPTTSTLCSVQTIIWEMISSITSKARVFFSLKKTLFCSGCFLTEQFTIVEIVITTAKRHKGLPWLLVGSAPSETGGLIAPEGVLTKLLSQLYWLPDFLGGTFSVLEGVFTLLDLRNPWIQQVLQNILHRPPFSSSLTPDLSI